MESALTVTDPPDTTPDPPAAAVDCPQCGGSGETQPGRDPQHVTRCGHCRGAGEIKTSDGAAGHHPAGASDAAREPGPATGFRAATIPLQLCTGCGGYPGECFAGCVYERTACRCHTRTGCYRHGVEPRQASVRCVGCHQPTWALDRLCDRCFEEVA